MSTGRIAEDDHGATIEHFLSQLVAPLETVVHVGAHAGEEVAAYRLHGARRIVLFEANAASCETLQQRFGDDADIDIVHVAITDHIGTERLLLHANSRGETESASLLPMKRLGEIVSSMHTEGAVDVPASTLDAELEGIGVDPLTVGLLVLDVQGAELRALRGATRALAGVRAVLTEVAFVELYDDAAQAEDVAQVLTAAGFGLVDTLSYELYQDDGRFPAWGDQLYARLQGMPS
jgi:FkbM family methyltransferase